MADRPPVIAAWGAGVDSTAMIVELAERGEPIGMVLFADPGAEKSRTYAFIPVFRAWMAEHGICSEIVRYQPRNFKHWPSRQHHAVYPRSRPSASGRGRSHC